MPVFITVFPQSLVYRRSSTNTCEEGRKKNRKEGKEGRRKKGLKYHFEEFLFQLLTFLPPN